MLTLFAVLSFATSSIWSAVVKSWPLALMGLGLTLATLAQFGPVKIG